MKRNPVRSAPVEIVSAPRSEDPSRPDAPKEVSGRGGVAVLCAILLLYVLLAAAHLCLAPTGATGYQNAPDEAAHLAYVYAISQGRMPTPSSGDSYEWHQPPLYYLLDVPFAHFGAHPARAFSILCGIGCILLVYCAGRLLRPAEPQTALLAAALAAFTPTHVAITSVVNNDALLELFFSASLLGMLICILRGVTARRTVAVALCISAAILTKATGLLLIPLFLIALLLSLPKASRLTTFVRHALLACATAAVTTGWWFVRNLRLYGELLPVRAFDRAFAGTMHAAAVADRMGGWGNYLVQMALGIFASFWAVYGTKADSRLGIPRFLPIELYELLAVACAVALVGLTILHFRRRSEFTPPEIAGVRLLAAAFGFVAVSFLLFILKYFQMQGRYLFPAMMPVAVLGAMGWRAIMPARYKDAASIGAAVTLFTIFLAYLRYVAPA